MYVCMVCMYVMSVWYLCMYGMVWYGMYVCMYVSYVCVEEGGNKTQRILHSFVSLSPFLYLASSTYIIFYLCSFLWKLCILCV